MMPALHISLGFLFSLAIYFLFNLNINAFLVLFFSTWIFDIEFPIRYALSNISKIREQGINRIYSYFLEKRKRLSRMPSRQKLQMLISSNKILLFHNIEFIAIVSTALFFILRAYNISLVYLWSFLAGIAFHLLLDILEGVSIKERYSLILFYIAKRKLARLKKKGEEWKIIE